MNRFLPREGGGAVSIKTPPVPLGDQQLNFNRQLVNN